MRLKTLLTDDDNAVSPVIGVILMVAITVILAAVIASFVLGLGPSDTAPTINFDSEYDGSTLTIEITGGDSVEAGRLSLSGAVDQEWTSADPDSPAASSELSAGDVATVSANSGDEVDVIWTSDDGSSTQTLSTFTAET